MKSIFKSKTAALNLVMAVAALFPSVQAAVGQEGIVAGFTVVNILMRLISKDKVTLF